MSTITIEPAGPGRFDDVEHAITGGGDGPSCQCQWFMVPNAEFSASTRADRERMLRAEVEGGTPPGLIASVDGEPAGFVRVGRRIDQPRLARTRLYAKNSGHDWADPDVWAITCFVVRREHRGEGLHARLLEAGVAYARAKGARVIEAYPVDPEVARKRANELFHGVVSTFLAAGFREVTRPKPEVAIVELDLR